MMAPPDALEPRHGGDLGYASARYGMPPGGWLDLSTGINPCPYPAPPLDPRALARLPDRAALARLIAAAREAYQVPASANLIAAPGSEIALRLVPFLLPDPVAIVGPTYGSHYEAWATSGRTVTSIAALDQVPSDARTVVLVNPNNPDGRTFAPLALMGLAEELAGRGGALVVDEAFAELRPHDSLVPSLDRVPAVVLRSFGKFFGLAGLRLGFVAGSSAPLADLGWILGDWPVSAAALAIGHAALSDTAWQAETRRRLHGAARRLRALLERHALTIAGGTDLFILVEHDDAARLHARLAEAGIWTRIFGHRRDWLRVGLPADDQAFARLDEALATSIDITARSTG